MVVSAASAETLVGSASSSEGRSVQITIQIKKDSPTDIRLSYSPVQLPISNDGDFFGTEATLNGVDGRSFSVYTDETETLVSQLHFFAFEPRPSPDNHPILKGKISRRESVISRWTGSQVVFYPSDGGNPVVTESDSIPGMFTYPTSGAIALSCTTIKQSAERRRVYELGGTKIDFGTGITAIRLRLTRATNRKWRIRVTTDRQYLDFDIYPSFRTVETGILRVR